MWLLWGCTKNLCSHFSFCSCGRFVTELVTEGMLSELLYVDDLILMSKTFDELCDKY